MFSPEAITRPSQQTDRQTDRQRNARPKLRTTTVEPITRPSQPSSSHRTRRPAPIAATAAPGYRVRG
eukprot:scaffold42072_cov57-Phaeocystis_antarctica.AAC.1